MTIQECYNIYLMSCEDDTDKIMTFEEYVNETIRMEQYGYGWKY